MMMTVSNARTRTRLGDVLARHQIVVDIHAEAQQIKIGADLQHGQRDPADQADGRKRQDLAEGIRGIGGDRRRRQADGKRDDEEGQSGGILGRVKNGAKIGGPAAQQTPQADQDRGVEQPRHGQRDDDDEERYRPSRREGEGAAQARQFGLQIMRDVLPHYP
jgi:hypothetical protein